MRTPCLTAQIYAHIFRTMKNSDTETTPILYTRLTPADLVAIAASSRDEVTHLRAMVEALAGCICRRHHSEMIADGAIFAAIESAAGAAMRDNADGDCVVEVRR